MIRFAHSEYLYLLLLIPVLVALFIVLLQFHRRAMNRFGNVEVLGRLAEQASRTKRWVKFTLLLLALAILIVGLANPQIGTRLEEVKQEGVDLFVALDVSLSMKAEDIKPNRLEKAKFEIRNLIGRLRGDRIGLVVFAGEAYTQFPLTTDYSAANLFLDAVDVDAVPTPGTSIGAAVERALQSFNFEEPSTKVLVLITDGENTEGDALEVAEEAARKGVLLYTIGMGSPTGTPIPVLNNAGQQVDFKRDQAGNVVMTRLDEATLERIATVGNGKYFRGTTAQDELNEIYKAINALQKREFGVRQFTDYEDRFQWLVGAGLLIVLLELLTAETRSRWLARWNPLKKEAGAPS
jgi:Ca-activated chloride channel family protein